MLELWILHGIIWQKATVKHLLRCLSRCIGDGVNGAWGALVVRFYKFSKVLHLDSLVVAICLMKDDPDKLHTVDQRIWQWSSKYHVAWNSYVTMKLFVRKCDKLTFCVSLKHVGNKILMCFNALQSSHETTAVKRSKLKYWDFNGAAAELNCRARSSCGIYSFTVLMVWNNYISVAVSLLVCPLDLYPPCWLLLSLHPNVCCRERRDTITYITFLGCFWLASPHLSIILAFKNLTPLYKQGSIKRHT